MIKFFYEVVRKQKSAGRPYWKLTYKLHKALVNLLFPLWAKGKKGCGVDGESKIIVSLTTYPARVGSVWITIASLLNQTMKPCKVILWLAEEQFPGHEIPKSLEKLKKRGLEIRFCEDLKPHKKYFYAMQEYPDYEIITADDDIFYPENHIEQLWRGHERYPGTVICHWSHEIAIDKQGKFQPYDSWIDNEESAPSYATLAVGCNGVYYPSGSLPGEAFQKDEVVKYSLYTDDLWLKCMEILGGRKTVNCNPTPLIYFNVLSTKNSGLWKSNTGEKNRNDVNWDKLMNAYPEVKKRLIEEKEHG